MAQLKTISDFRGRKPKNATPQVSNVLGFDEPPSDTEPIDNMFPIIDGPSTSYPMPHVQTPSMSYAPPYIQAPPQGYSQSQPPLTYQTQHFHVNQTPSHLYQYPHQTLCCSRCDQPIIGYGSHAKCTACPKVCCFNCSHVYYSLANGYFTCERCLLHSSLVKTEW